MNSEDEIAEVEAAYDELSDKDKVRVENYDSLIKARLEYEELVLDEKYNAAVELMDAGRYDEAISSFEKLDGYKDSADNIKECNYQLSVAMMDAGQYDTAAGAFRKSDSYKDSASQNAICQKMISEIEIGSTVSFGTYEQDNDDSNGKETREWIILAKQDNYALLISRYALDSQKYNTTDDDVDLESCTLRTWLNDTFLQNAFSSAEIAKIAISEVSVERKDKNNNDIIVGHTQDKVFLLSKSETENFFSSNTERICEPTAYAEFQRFGYPYAFGLEN